MEFGNKFKKALQYPFEEVVVDSINITNESVSKEFQPFNIAENVNNKLPKLYFDLILSDEQWKSIHPISKLYKEKGKNGKTYKVLNTG